MGQKASLAEDVDDAVEVLSATSDDILQKEDGPLLAAQIGSELQKRFAILPGCRGIDGHPVIFLPEFPAFDELPEEEFQNVLRYLTSVPRLVFLLFLRHAGRGGARRNTVCCQQMPLQ
uniref:Uncharacterized protein n=1 Tax=Fundulus heteroclitus TaxID=8078 RepID=A0A3Q2R0D8_FUNHE